MIIRAIVSEVCALLIILGFGTSIVSLCEVNEIWKSVDMTWRRLWTNLFTEVVEGSFNPVAYLLLSMVSMTISLSWLLFAAA